MKRLLATLCLAFAFCAARAAEPLIGMRQGVRYDYTTYTETGEAVSRYSIENTAVRTSRDTTYITRTVTEGDKSESVTYYVRRGRLYFPMRGKIGGMMESMVAEANENRIQDHDDHDGHDHTSHAHDEIRIEISGEDFNIPFDAFEGEKLPSAQLTCRFVTDGIEDDYDALPKIKCTISGKVLPPQRITTPAGEFDCTVVRMTTKVGMLFFNETQHIVYYFAPRIGAVRTDEVTRAGAIISYSLLDKITEPRR